MRIDLLPHCRAMSKTFSTQHPSHSQNSSRSIPRALTHDVRASHTCKLLHVHAWPRVEERPPLGKSNDGDCTVPALQSAVHCERKPAPSSMHGIVQSQGWHMTKLHCLGAATGALNAEVLPGRAASDTQVMMGPRKGTAPIHEQSAQHTCETSVVPSNGSTAMSTCTKVAGRTPSCPCSALRWTLCFCLPA